MRGLEQTATNADAGSEQGPAYRARRSILEKEATWRLAPDALEQIVDGKPVQGFLYADIVEIRLSYDPTRFESNRYRCDVRARNGARVVLVSVSYVSPGNFDNRGEIYAPFVRELVARVASANPACGFIAGRPLVNYLASHAFLIAMLLLLLSVLYATGAPIVGIVALKLGLIVVYVPVIIHYARVNWPRPFEPAAVPEHALPRP